MRMMTSRSTTSVRTSSDGPATAKLSIAGKSERKSVNGIWLVVIPGNGSLAGSPLNNQ
jgi:hypothetical protein